MPRIFGELKDATFENLSSDPSSNVAGRFWRNTTDGKFKTDDGTNKRALLRNDDKLIVGNSGTANDNIRMNRAAAGVLQFVPGGNATTEGSLATALAQLSSRLENYTDALKPAAGNAGRLIFVTDLLEVQYDNGSTWLPIAGSATGGWGASGVFVVTTNTILTSGDARRVLLCDVTGGSFSIQLPAPTANFLISVKDILGLFGTYPVTLTRSGAGVRIENLASDYILERNYGSWNIICDGSHYYFV